MATNNKNRFISLPAGEWSSTSLTNTEEYGMDPIFTSPVGITTGQTSIILHAIFNDNVLAFLCDKDGKLILRRLGTYISLIDKPIVKLAPYKKSGIISSPARSTYIDITYKKKTSSSEESIVYNTKKVTTITEKVKDFTWRDSGHGDLYLKCSTSGWEGGDLGDLASMVHGILKDELNNEDNYPAPDILGITSEDNDARDTRESFMTSDIAWPNEEDNKGDSELSITRSSEALFNISYIRNEEDKCTGTLVDENGDGKLELVEKRTQKVSESLESSETSGDQFGLVFPLLLGSSKIEITASISTSISSTTIGGGRDLKAEELSEVPVYITWGKIGEGLISDNGCVLDARMPDLGVFGAGATKGFPTFTGLSSQSEGAIQIMMDDTSSHSIVCEIPRTHVMWFKIGLGIKELFNKLKTITLLEITEQKPSDFAENGGSYTVVERRISASISIGVIIKVKVVG